MCRDLKQFPSISIKHSGHVANTITHIVAPTKRSLNGTLKLTGSPLRTYHQRIWKPRVRTAKSGGRLSIFALKQYVNPIIVTLTHIEADESYPNNLEFKWQNSYNRFL